MNLFAQEKNVGVTVSFRPLRSLIKVIDRLCCSWFQYLWNVPFPSAVTRIQITTAFASRFKQFILEMGVSLSCLAWPGTCYVSQAGFGLRSSGLSFLTRLQACAATLSPSSILLLHTPLLSLKFELWWCKSVCLLMCWGLNPGLYTQVLPSFLPLSLEVVFGF